MSEADSFWKRWTWKEVGHAIDKAIMQAKRKVAYWTDGPFGTLIDYLPTDLQDEEILVMLEEAFYEWHDNHAGEPGRPSKFIMPALRDFWAEEGVD